MYTDLQILRKRLADNYKYGYDEQVGDGEATVYKLTHGNVRTDSLEVFVADEEQAVDVDYTLDVELGLVEFVSAPDESDEIKFVYYYAAFSDEELTEFLSSEGSVDRALLLCIEILMADSAKQFDYSSGQANLKPNQVFYKLDRLRSQVLKTLSRKGGDVTVSERTNRHYTVRTPTTYDLSRSDLEDLDD